jgi:hypothetical protein
MLIFEFFFRKFFTGFNFFARVVTANECLNFLGLSQELWLNESATKSNYQDQTPNLAFKLLKVG